MNIFQNILVMLVLACVLLQLSRRASVPYPSLLALAGVGVGALPWSLEITIDPHLALVLFIAPALLDSAFDTSPRALRRNWLPLMSLVVIAVVLTTAVVAWAGWALAGLPLAAAITLGAIVAPPDAVASAAVMEQFRVPRRTLSILHGESLLNDAGALMIFGMAVYLATTPNARPLAELPVLLAAVPGGALLGFASGRLNLWAADWFAGARSAIIFQFVTTFGTWIVAERLKLSPIIAVVALGMTVAQHAPVRHSAHDRVHANAVWGAVVFALNVLAFLLMGLQARIIVSKLKGPALWDALEFAAIVFLLVITTRLAWVMTYGVLLRLYKRRFGVGNSDIPVPSLRTGLLVGWSGMRGLVTLATSFALPASFPGRDLIVLSAFCVVLGTLVLQGFTIGPLIRLLKIEPDQTLDGEIAVARRAMLEAATAALASESGPAAAAVRDEYVAAAEATRDPDNPQPVMERDRMRLQAIGAQRQTLIGLRDDGKIADDVYRRLEEELDLQELSASDAADFQRMSV